MNGLRSPLIAALNKERVTKSLLHANCLIKGRRPSGILEIRYRILYIFCIIQHVHLYHPRKTIYYILITAYLIENDMIDHMQAWIFPVAFCIILYVLSYVRFSRRLRSISKLFLDGFTKCCAMKKGKNIWPNRKML